MDLKQVERWARDAKVWPMLQTAVRPEEQPLVDKMNEQMLYRWDNFAKMAAEAGAAAEREDCAQVCEAEAAGSMDHGESVGAKACAAAIRARGTPPAFTRAEQWTEEEIAAIKARGAPPLVFNEIKKAGTP